MIYNSQNSNGQNGNDGKKKPNNIKEVPKSKFSFVEIFVVTIIVLLVVGLTVPKIFGQLEKAKDEALYSHARAIWILTATALNLDEYTEKDLEKFTDKYSDYQKLEELEKGELLLETCIVDRVKKLDSANLFVKIDIEDGNLKAVYVSKDAKGEKFGSYSE